LHERLGAPLRAAALWLRGSASAGTREEAADLARRACEAYLAGGDVEVARRVLEGMGTWTRSERLLELGVEVERRRQNPVGLAEALDELAAASSRSPEERAALLVEAARSSLAAGDHATALAQASRAARTAPEHAESQLMARYLEYLARGGPGSADEARVAGAELRAMRGDLSVEQMDLRSFLTAEALDRALGSDAGLRELSRSRAELGETPLVALGMAERLEASEPAQALPLFERALAGDLRGLRVKSRIALAAAQAAQRLNEIDRALGYLDSALGDPDTRDAALALSAELTPQRSARTRSAPPTGTRPLSSRPPAAPAPTMTGHVSSRPPAAPSFPEPAPTIVGAPPNERGRYSQRPPSITGEDRLPGAEPAPTTERIPAPPAPPRSLSPVESVVPRSPRNSPVPEEEARLGVPSAPPPSPRGPNPRSLGSMRPSVSGRYSVSTEVEERVPALSQPPVIVPADAPAAEGPKTYISEPKIPQVRTPDPRPTFESRPEIQAALDMSATFVGQEASGEQALYDALRRG
jgi:tetratricopeptide (TPR) repeat protein